LLKEEIALRPSPEVRFLKQLITFNSAIAGGEAKNVLTPKSSEPLMVLGIKTTLAASKIEMKIEGETDWCADQIPVWGIASLDTNTDEIYRMFQKPIYLPANMQISSTIENGLNGSIDDETDNTITFIAETI
jgi:hypothetical protein